MRTTGSVSASIITLALTDPTEFPMRLRVMVESEGDLSPLGADFAVQLHNVETDPGQTIGIELATSEFHPHPISVARRQMES